MAAKKKVATNAKKRSTKKPAKSNRVTIEKYNSFYEAWAEKQSIEYVAAKCGVSWHTARKYIENGDKRRKLPPIAERFATALAKANAKEDYNITRARRETLLMVRAVESKLAQRIEKILKEEFAANDIPKHLKTLLETKAKALGEPDLTVAAKSDRWADWTDEELEAFVYTGEKPDHAKE